jgi:hypothetical protein
MFMERNNMPIKLNCGLSKKVADNNYGSRGASIHMEVEVESSLSGDPAGLKERIRRVFSLVRDSLAEELKGVGTSQPRTPNQNGHTAPASNSNGQKTPPRAATQSQVRAIGAIAKRLQLNIDDLLGQRYHVTRPQDLSIKQASEFIDELNKNNGG